MTPTRIIILGTKGMGMDIADTIACLAAQGAAVEVRGFLDDDVSTRGGHVGGHPVLGALVDAAKFEDCVFVNGIGTARSRHLKPDLIARTGIPPERWLTIVHPRAFVSPSARVGRGTVLLANVTVCADAVVGDHVMVLPNSVISHDTVVEDYSTIASGVCISGRCLIRRGAYLGSNSSIRESSVVGEGAMVAMAAVVTRDVAPGVTVLGCPARPIEAQS